MRLKITDVRKATDEKVVLQGVPFDADRQKIVEKALMTLGDTVAEVAEIVQLTRRTNQALYFTFNGPVEKLKAFFEYYYNHMTWEEIRAKYSGNGIEEKEKEKQAKEEEKKSIGKALAKFFLRYNIPLTKIKYNSEQKIIKLFGVEEKVRGSVITDIPKLDKVLIAFNLEFKTFYTKNGVLHIALKDK